MVDDQVDRHQRVDLPRVFAGTLHRGSHRREVNDGRHACEVLHEDASGKKRQLGVGRRQGGPVREHADVRLFRDARLDKANEALEQDLDRHREVRQVFAAGVRQVLQRVEVEAGATELRPLDHVEILRLSDFAIVPPPPSR